MDNAAARAPKAKATEKKSLYAKLADFLRRFRVVIISVFGAAILAVVAVAAISAINSAQLKASAASLEKLEADYSSYSTEQDQAKKAELQKSFLVSADAVAKKWGKRYAGQKALVYKAKIAESSKDWAAAEKDYLAAVAVNADSYLAPVALQGAAVAAEELGAPDRAITAYKKLLDKYAASSLGIAHAHFALGRLAEQAKDYAGAVAEYQKIVAGWPESDWTKLANDRIIFVKSSGLVK
jgi:tetratricopeptide (TPR) repeat protein